jgi:hypothetical protein
VQKFLEAKKMYTKQKLVFEELDKSIPHHITCNWREVPLEPVKKGTKWTSPFENADMEGPLLSLIEYRHVHILPCLSGGKFQEVVHRERQTEVEGAAQPSRRIGATRWLANVIEMEHAMYVQFYPVVTRPWFYPIEF